MRPRSPSRLLERGPRGRQQGAALIIALVLLVIMTLLGLSSMRTVSLEEKMSGHTYDRSISFQATEAALREAEAWVAANKPTPAAGAACTASGVCGRQTSGDVDMWLDESITNWAEASEVESGSVSVTPQYLIEYLGNTFPCQPNDPSANNDCRRYRITARSNAGDDRANVMLQSIFATE